MDWILSVLIWLSADKVEIDKQGARAASCCSLSYATMYRAKITEDDDACNCEEDCKGQCDGKCCESCECEIEPAGGGTPPAQPKRMVKRCVNGRCVITYE